MTHDVRIQRSRCDCGSDNKSKKENCRSTILDSSLKFTVQRSSARSESQWNLALLSLSKHPEFDKKMEAVKHVNYLSLETAGLGKDPIGESRTNREQRRVSKRPSRPA